MRLTGDIYLVGGGIYGFGLSHDSDCHVYAVVSGRDIALIDAGSGLGMEQIVASLHAHGLDAAQVGQVFITHYHADHCGGAHAWREVYGSRLVASPQTATALRSADEQATGLAAARTAGVYPADFHLTPCPAVDEVTDGANLRVGSITLKVIDTPGHCRGHLAFYGKIGDRVCLFAGDSVFFGGRILIQNIPDCILSEYCATILRLAELTVDALLPGHLMLSLHGGQRHLSGAADMVRALRIPPNVL